MTTIPTIDLVDALASEYADKSPSEIMKLALELNKVKLPFPFLVQKMLY